MKAVVLEIKGKYAAVMNSDGTVVKIKNRGYHVSEEIFLEQKRITAVVAMRIMAAAAVLMLCFGGFGYYDHYLVAYAYVTVDVNPSIEYALNKEYQVLKVSALNEDAELIVQELSQDGIRGTTLETALKKTREHLYADGYLVEEEENVMLLSVASDREEMRADLRDAVGRYVELDKLEVCVVDTDLRERKEAIEHAMSTGRYEVSRPQDGEVRRSDADTAPVRELLEENGFLPDAETTDAGQPGEGTPQNGNGTEQGQEAPTEPPQNGNGTEQGQEAPTGAPQNGNGTEQGQEAPTGAPQNGNGTEQGQEAPTGAPQNGNGTGQGQEAPTGAPQNGNGTGQGQEAPTAPPQNGNGTEQGQEAPMGAPQNGNGTEQGQEAPMGAPQNGNGTGQGQEAPTGAPQNGEGTGQGQEAPTGAPQNGNGIGQGQEAPTDPPQNGNGTEQAEKRQSGTAAGEDGDPRR